MKLFLTFLLGGFVGMLLLSWVMSTNEKPNPHPKYIHFAEDAQGCKIGDTISVYVADSALEIGSDRNPHANSQLYILQGN